MASTRATTGAPSPDARGWFAALAGDGISRDAALFRLRALLVAVSAFEIDRRHEQLSHLSTAETARLVRDAADAACASLLSRLDDYRGQSRFEVWTAKFAIHEAAAAARDLGSANTRKRAAARDTDGRVDFRRAQGDAS